MFIESQTANVRLPLCVQSRAIINAQSEFHNDDKYEIIFSIQKHTSAMARGFVTAYTGDIKIIKIKHGINAYVQTLKKPVMKSVKLNRIWTDKLIEPQREYNLWIKECQRSKKHNTNLKDRFDNRTMEGKKRELFINMITEFINDNTRVNLLKKEMFKWGCI